MLVDRSEGGYAWLNILRSQKHTPEGNDFVRTALLTLCGVGPKVADCVALFSLDRNDVIPVDTHVWQIACRDLDHSLKNQKSLTPSVYARVGDLFRQRYSPYAGWAHSLLFAAELAQYRVFLPQKMQSDMLLFTQQEKVRKLELKDKKASKKGSEATIEQTQGTKRPASHDEIKIEKGSEVTDISKTKLKRKRHVK